VLRFEDALALVQRRGELMHRAGIERPGTMAAILGLSPDGVEAVCREASSSGVVVPANLNSPEQVAISGEIPAVERACEIAKAHGAKRAIRLEVGGAFHSPLMESAARGLAEKLDETEFADARCPVVCNVSAQPLVRGAEIREALKAQLLSAVRWVDTMRFLIAAPIEGAVEVGSGKVLRGLLRTVDRDVPSWNVEDPQSLQSTLGALGAAEPSGGKA
jgi:[acyl-carrier-protein] S-malonyltransferase